MKTGEREKLLKSRLAHLTNPLHVYCRLLNKGISKKRAKRICILYENLGKSSLNLYKSSFLFVTDLSINSYSNLSKKGGIIYENSNFEIFGI